jgi:hypothetical protein
MFLIELDIDSLGLALLGSAPYNPSKRTRLGVSFILISAYTTPTGVKKSGEGGEVGEGRRTPQKYTPNLVFRVASLPGRYCPCSIL